MKRNLKLIGKFRYLKKVFKLVTLVSTQIPSYSYHLGRPSSILFPSFIIRQKNVTLCFHKLLPFLHLNEQMAAFVLVPVSFSGNTSSSTRFTSGNCLREFIFPHTLQMYALSGLKIKIFKQCFSIGRHSKIENYCMYNVGRAAV